MNFPPSPPALRTPPPAPKRPPQIVPLSMTKPGTVTAAQTLMWALTAFGTAGNAYSAVNLARAVQPLGVVGLVCTVAAAALPILFAVNLGRGRRWAWLWPVIGSSLALPVAALMILTGLEGSERALQILMLGIVQAATSGTLLGLLCTAPTRRWILVNRLRRGEVRVEAVPRSTLGSVPPGSVVVAESERPAKRPVSVTLLLITVAALAPTPSTAVAAAIAEARRDLASSTEEPPPSLAGLLLGEHLPELLLSLVLVLAVAAAALVSIIGLRRGRWWARVHTAIWTGVAAAGSLLWIQLSVDWLHDTDGTEHAEVLEPSLVAMSSAAGLAGVLALIAFCTTLSGGVRRWTPGPRYLVAAASGG